jgi:hypothetical protein
VVSAGEGSTTTPAGASTTRSLRPTRKSAVEAVVGRA